MFFNVTARIYRALLDKYLLEVVLDRLDLYLIKPTRYDDDGYPLQWMWSIVPSNSLAVMHGLLMDCADRKVLGPSVRIDIRSYDEDNTRIRTKRLAAELAGATTSNDTNLSLLYQQDKSEGKKRPASQLLVSPMRAGQ